MVAAAAAEMVILLLSFRREESKRVEYTERAIREKEGPHIRTWREHVDINRMKRYEELQAQR